MKRLLFIQAILSIALCAPAWPQTGSASTPEELVNSILSSGLDSLRQRLVLPTGSVVKVSGTRVYIASASKAELESGRELEIVRVKETITNPATGETLGVITKPVGKVRVISSNGKLVIANAIGRNDIKPGDTIGGAGDAHVALIVTLSVSSWAPEEVSRALSARLKDWEGVSWASGYAVERFVYDRKITSRQSVENVKTLRDLKKQVGADLLVYLDIRQKADAILADAALYDLGKTGSVAPVALFKGLTPVGLTPVGLTPAGLARGGAAPVGLTPAGLTRKEVAPAGSATGHNKPVARPVPTRAPNLAEQAAPASLPVVAPVPASVPAKPEAGVVKPSAQNKLLGAGVKAKRLARFDKHISALMVHDFDGDGAGEIVVGFTSKVAVFKLTDGKLEKVWEKKLGGASQVVGLCVGDFNGNGKAEIYVSRAVNSRIRSLVFEQVGGSFNMILKDQKLVFYTGEDRRLYGRGQKPDYNLSENLSSLTWNGNGFDSAPFMTLPKNRRLTGLGILDMDGDGAMDVVGYDKGRRFTYHLSSEKKWERISGKFAGSNVSFLIYMSDETEVRQKFPAPVQAFPKQGAKPGLLLARNEAPISIVANPTYTKGQLVYLEHDGANYLEKAVTPMVDGAISAIAVMDGVPTLTLIARNHFSFFGKGESELVLVNPLGY